MKFSKVYRSAEFQNFEHRQKTKDRHFRQWLSVAAMAVLVATSWAEKAMAQLIYSYSQLAIKDLDEMSKLVQAQVQASKRAKADKTSPLREGLFLVFSRPNPDFLIEKIVAPLKNELDGLGSWESSLKILVNDSISILKNAGNIKANVQVTHLVFLENIVSELKPRAKDGFERGILQSIADADIKVSKAARAQRKLSMMKIAASPSTAAKAVLEASAQSGK